MTKTSAGLVIVGAGHAGGRAVEAMRLAEYDGPVTLIGAEPHLPYERPPLSKELLIGGDGPGAAFKTLRDEAFYADNHIDLVLSDPVEAVDRASRSLTLKSGGTLPYDKLLLTTGGRVRELSLPGAELNNIVTLRTVDDSRAISAALDAGARLVVIGGGFIGLEVAASARRRGARVSVLEAGARLMGRAVLPDIADAFAALHRDEGVDLRFNQTIVGFEGDGNVSAVKLGNGDVLPADMVVVGIGIDPETALAESCGLEIDNGIRVDEYCRTADPHIFAAGDAVNAFNPWLGRRLRQETWQNAQNQSAAAGATMAGKESAYAEPPWFWSDQFDANLQAAGFPETWDAFVVRGDISERDFIAFQLQGTRLAGAVSINRARDMRVARKLMEAERPVNAGELQDESVKLKTLLKGH